MYLLYNGLLLVASLSALPYFAVKSLRTTKYRAGLRQRFGHVSPEVVSALQGGRPLWLHAVSVGEVIAAVPLVNALRQRFPHLPILISTVTETGQTTAREKMAAAAFLYFPLDYGWVVRQVIARLQPRLFLMVETEIWPNFLHELTQQEIPAILLNGRISPRSFRGYRRLRPFMRRVLASITTFSMQTKLDAERIIAIGAEPSHVHITGNIKYDLPLTPLSRVEEQALRTDLGIGDAPVFMAGSTHRGEEDIVITAYRRARIQMPTLRLLLAPRHLDRLDEIEELLRKHQLGVHRRSHGPVCSQSGKAPVLLLDTIGELAKLYAIGAVVFVGGSFVPVGGHNVLEPAAHHKAILFGPHMHNFHQIATALLEAGGAVQVQNPEDLGAHVSMLLQQHARRQALGEAAYQVLRANQGAIARTLQLVASLLDEESRHGHADLC
jgi:3-deoxy-D-manno-octulosonic-acid transferase